MVNFRISSTENYEKLVPFFIDNDLEFSEDEPAPTDLVKCWQIVEGSGGFDDNNEADDGKLIGAFVLSKREGEFVVDGIAIAPEYRKLKLGRLLLDKGIEETLKQGGRRIFLVARAPGFFAKHGFKTVSREEAPGFVECLTCPQYGKTCHPEVMRLDM